MFELLPEHLAEPGEAKAASRARAKQRIQELSTWLQCFVRGRAEPQEACMGPRGDGPHADSGPSKPGVRRASVAVVYNCAECMCCCVNDFDEIMLINVGVMKGVGIR